MIPFLVVNCMIFFFLNIYFMKDYWLWTIIWVLEYGHYVTHKIHGVRVDNCYTCIICKQNWFPFILNKVCKSFIQRRKSKGPSMDPCGTPCLILPHSEAVWWPKVMLFISSLWYLSTSYDLIQLLVFPVIPYQFNLISNVS
jgi:hypothetical protein